MQTKMLASITLAVIIAALAITSVRGADHLDSPLVILPANQDITDLYVFHPGNSQDRSKTVFVLDVNPLTPAGLRPAFSSDALYQIKIDTNGDAVPDMVFRVKFSSPNPQGVQNVILRLGTGKQAIQGVGGMTIATGKTDSVITFDGGGKLFAGLRDDPFFFDLVAFKEGLAFCATDPAPDFFEGTNISAIAIEVPTSMLGASSIGVWVAISVPNSNGDFVQVDRMARPAINTVFIPSAQKAAFNQGEPVNDQAQFRSFVVSTLIALGNSAARANALADILLPDILTVDLNADTGYLNGRGLADDVIDISLDIISDGAITTDCVDSNDVSFLSAFPYLAAPHT